MDIDTNVRRSYLTDPESIEKTAKQILKLPSHPHSTAGWWCTYTDRMTPLIPFHAESLLCPLSLWTEFRETVARQLATCVHCTVAYQKAIQQWELSHHFQNLEPESARDLLRSLTRWNIERLHPSFRCGALEKADSDAENTRRREACRMALNEALICPRVCMDRRVYTLIFAIFRRYFPIEKFNDMLPLVEEFGEVPGGLLYLCFHPKGIVHSWAQEALEECVTKYPLSTATSRYVIDRAFRVVRTRLTNASCNNIPGLLETPLVVLLQALSVILPLLEKEPCAELFAGLNGEAVSTLAKGFEHNNYDIVVAAASCLEAFLSTLSFEELFKDSTFSINKLLQSILNAIRRNVKQDNGSADVPRIKETGALLRLFAPLCKIIRNGCSKVEAARLFSYAFEALDGLINDCKYPNNLNNMSPELGNDILHYNILMTCTNVLTWFYESTAPKRPFNDAQGISKIVLASLRLYPEEAWSWNLLRVVLTSDVINFMRCVLQRGVESFAETAKEDVVKTPKRDGINGIIHQLTSRGDAKYGITFAITLWNDVRNGRHVPSSKLTSTVIDYETRIFLDLHSVIGACDAARIAADIDIEKINWDQVQGMSAGDHKYIQDSFHLMQDTIAKRLMLALGKDSEQNFWKDLPFHATHLLSSFNKSLSDESMRTLMRSHNLQGITVGGSKGKMLVQRLKTNSDHVQNLSSGLSSTASIMHAWGSMLSMGAHARFFLWYTVLVDLKVVDCFTDGSWPWILGLLLTFVSSWKQYESGEAKVSSIEVSVRFFTNLRQLWTVLGKSVKEVLSNDGDSPVKRMLTEIAFGLLDMHEIHEDVPRSMWVYTVNQIAPSVRHITGLSKKVLSILEVHAGRRDSLSMRQCMDLAESFQIPGAEALLNSWKEENAENSKRHSNVVASMSAKKSGLSILSKSQRSTKIEDHFKPVSASSATSKVSDGNNSVASMLSRHVQRDSLSRRYPSLLDPAGAVRQLARTPGAPALPSIRVAHTPKNVVKKPNVQNSMSKIALLRHEQRSAASIVRGKTSKKVHVVHEIDDSKDAPAPQKTKYDLIREQKKLEAEQRRSQREKALRAEKQSLNSRSLTQAKGMRKELLRLSNTNVSRKRVGNTVSEVEMVAFSKKERTEITTFALPNHLRFCELRSMDEVYRHLLGGKPCFSTETTPQIRNGRFPSVDSYVRFWEPLLIEECRASVESAVAEESSLSEKGGSKHRLEFTVSDSVESIGYFQVLNISRDMKDVVRPLPGSEGEEYSVFKLHNSDLVLLDIPPVVFDSTVSVKSTKAIAMVVSVEFSRGQVAIKLNAAFRSVDMAPGKGRVISVCRLMSLTTFQRQFDALRIATKIPDGVLWPILNPREGLDINHKVVDRLAYESQPDLAIPRKFIKCLRDESRLNKSQANAISSVLRSCTPILQSRSASNSRMGDFGGITLIQGPPGTGKTSTIVALLSTLLLSGSSGSKMRRAGISIEGQRMSVRLPPIRILVCAPSNAAVDEIMARVVNDGLIMPGGVRTCPRVVRVGGGTTMQCLQCLDLRRLAKCDEPCSAFEDMLDEASASKRKHLGSMHKLNSEIGELDRARRVNQDRLTKVMSESNNYEEIQKVEREIRIQTEGLSSLHRQKNELHELLTKDRNMSKEAELVRRREQDKNMCHVVNGASIVFATLSSSGHEILQRFSARFDVIVVDEAAQCCEPDILIPITVGRRSSTATLGFGHMVLVGDPRQLPATILSNNPGVSKPMGRSLFERLAEQSPESVHLLKVQYRMHPKISAFPSLQFYDGRLIDAKNVLSKSMVQPFHNDSIRRFGPLTFLDTSSRSSREVRSASGSISNPEEVRVVVSAIVAMIETYSDYDFSNNIAVLSPYREQVARIKRALSQNQSTRNAEIEVNTIDGIQGREKSIVFLSTVRGENGQAIGFLRDERRMNVAITRAKHSVIIVGHSKLLGENSSAWASLISYCREKECFRQIPANCSELFPKCKPEIQTDQAGPNRQKRSRSKAPESDGSLVAKKARKQKSARGQGVDLVTKPCDRQVASQQKKAACGRIDADQNAQEMASSGTELHQAKSQAGQTSTSVYNDSSKSNEAASGDNEFGQTETKCDTSGTSAHGREVLDGKNCGEIGSSCLIQDPRNDNRGSHHITTSASLSQKSDVPKSEVTAKSFSTLKLRSVPMPLAGDAIISTATNEASLGHKRSVPYRHMLEHSHQPGAQLEGAPKALSSPRRLSPAVSTVPQDDKRVRTGCYQKAQSLQSECSTPHGTARDVKGYDASGCGTQKSSTWGPKKEIENQSPSNNVARNVLSRLGKRDENQIGHSNMAHFGTDPLLDHPGSTQVHLDMGGRGDCGFESYGQDKRGRKRGRGNSPHHQPSWLETGKYRPEKHARRADEGPKQEGLRGDDGHGLNQSVDRDARMLRNRGRGRGRGKRRRVHGARQGAPGANPSGGFSLLETGRQLERTNEIARRAQRF